MCGGGGGGGGAQSYSYTFMGGGGAQSYSYTFIYTYAWPIYGLYFCYFQYCRGFYKINTFIFFGRGGGCEYLWVSLQNWTIFLVIPMCFMVFSQGECIVNSIFCGGRGGGLKFEIFSW